MNKNNFKTFLFFTLILSISIYSLFDDGTGLEKLEKYYTNCDYKKAIMQAQYLLQDTTTDKNDKRKILIIKGISEFSINQVLNSKITFTELLFMDKGISLDPEKVSPKIIDFFYDLKQKLLAENI